LGEANYDGKIKRKGGVCEKEKKILPKKFIEQKLKSF